MNPLTEPQRERYRTLRDKMPLWLSQACGMHHGLHVTLMMCATSGYTLEQTLNEFLLTLYSENQQLHASLLEYYAERPPQALQ